jgi:hypothetical protein
MLATESTAAVDATLGLALTVRARNAIAGCFGLDLALEPPHPALGELGATFVTLRCAGELRGCIGTLIPMRPLEDDVRHSARAAAFADPRFEPLRRDEFGAVAIEVSVIGLATPLRFDNEAHALTLLRPFEDGITLRWRGAGSTLLPQVWQSLPQPKDFLVALKRKAGLPHDFWADDIELSRYSVVHFVEATEVLTQ